MQMSVADDGLQDALASYLRALETGADTNVALDVALAKLRASKPLAQDWELRGAFAILLAQSAQRKPNRSH